MCSVPDCTIETNESSEALLIAIIGNHNLAHQPAQNAGAASINRGPKLERPRIEMGVDSETWNAFERRWINFSRGCGIDAASASLQLFQCTSVDLGDALLKANPTITMKSVVEVITAMKSLAVIPVSRGVKRAELVTMQQSPDETFRAFSVRVRGKAETCCFT